MKRTINIQDFVYRNDLDSVKNSLRKDPECINSVDSEGKTALMIAAAFNRTEVLDILLSSTVCEVNCVDSDGNSAFHEAADHGYTAIVKGLIESGRCDVNIQNLQGETALMKAAVYDYVDIVRLILKDEALNLNATDVLGQTALFVALREGSQLTADILIKAGCDVNIVDKTGKSTLYIAIHSPLVKSLASAKKVVEAGYDITIDKMWILNEEKHLLFYQDDEFYTNLRQRLRHHPNDLQFPESRSHTLERTNSPPSPLSMSPMIKQKLLSPDAFINKPIDWSTPPSSPVHFRRMASRSSVSSTRPSLSSKSSSFDSDGHDSHCSSPGIFAYPTSHIVLHSFLKKQLSEGSAEENLVYSRQNSLNNKICDNGTCSSTETNDPKNNTCLRKTSIVQLKNIDRQKSEIAKQTTENKQIKERKISLPSKPSVHFNKNIQIIDIQARR